MPLSATKVFLDRLAADLTPADRLLYAEDGIALGAFRALPSDAVFSDTKSLNCYYLVFPRTTSEIHLERGPAAVNTPVNIVAYNAGDTYRRFAVSDSGDASDYLALDASFLEEFLVRELDVGSRSRGDLLFSQFNTVQSKALFLRQRLMFDQLLNAASECKSVMPLDGFALRERIVEILISAVSTGISDRGVLPELSLARQRAIAESVMKHLCRYFCESLDLASLASLAGVSQGHLTRIFRRQTGLSIHQFVTEMRLRSSLELLLETGSITDAATHLGFAQHSHFTSTFRRAFGITPSDYLRSMPPAAVRKRFGVVLAEHGSSLHGVDHRRFMHRVRGF